MVRRLLIAGVLLAAAPAPAAAQTCPDADAQVASAGAAGAGAAVRCLVDAERTARGVPALEPDAALDRAAQAHADDMLRNAFFSHYSQDGSSPGDRIVAAGYAFWAWGENLAFGQDTPREAVLAWMRSEGHCRNVLDARFTQLGIGIATGLNAYWVQNFGRPTAGGTSGAMDAGSACPVAELGAPGGVPAGASPGAPAAGTPSTTDRPARPKRWLLRMRTRRAGKRVRISGAVTRASGVRRLRLTLKRGRRSRAITVRVRRARSFSVVVRPPGGRGKLRVSARPLR